MKIGKVKIKLIWIVIVVSALLVCGLLFQIFPARLNLFIFVLGALTYIFISFLHHYKEGTMQMEAMVEYILIGLLGIIILQSFSFP